jgi:hypothetical protein
VESYSFTLGNENDFTITMTEEANAIEKLYEYTIEATTEGGATATVSGLMNIEKKCLAQAV